MATVNVGNSPFALGNFLGALPGCLGGTPPTVFKTHSNAATSSNVAAAPVVITLLPISRETFEFLIAPLTRKSGSRRDEARSRLQLLQIDVSRPLTRFWLVAQRSAADLWT